VKANREQMVSIGFYDFHPDTWGAQDTVGFVPDSFRFIFKFSDGSEITVQP
jgi:hypothetical protein